MNKIDPRHCHPEGPSDEACCNMQASTLRSSAQIALQRKAKRLRDEAHDLEQLAEQLPFLSDSAEAALHKLVMGR